MPQASDPAVHAIRSSWRHLTGGSQVRDADRRTLIACSGGADSAALVLALAGVSTRPVVAHIVHDMRPEPQAHADRDATRSLAESLGLEYVEAAVSLRDSKDNQEARARTLRYKALAKLAEQLGIRWIATGHHADDQLETMLMRLIRGTGPEGLAGVLPSREVQSCTIIRPMLSLTRADAEHLCSVAGVAWCEDATNRDETRLRAALRARVLPVLEELSPGAATRAAGAADLQGELVRVLNDAIKQLVQAASRASSPGTVCLDRKTLGSARPVVLAGLVRNLAGERGRDRRGRDVLDQVVAAINDHSQGSREFNLGGAVVRVGSDLVEISPAMS